MYREKAARCAAGIGIPQRIRSRIGPNGHGRNGNGSPSDDANGYDMEKGGTRKSRGTPSMTKRAERYKPLTKKRITSRKTSQQYQRTRT